MSGLESVIILQRARQQQQQQQQQQPPAAYPSNHATTTTAVVADQILLDALCKSTDRIFLLDVEQQILDFMENTRLPRLCFPKQNSYRRLLLHKLADYYTLSHVVAGRYRDEIVFYRKQNQPPSSSNMASEWSAVCLPELLSTVVPPECVIVDDNIAAAECCDHPDFDATVASPVAPSFTKILVKKRNPDDVDSKRRASTRAGSAQPSTMDAALEAGLPADGAGSSVEDPVATDAAMTRLSPSSGVDACCEKLAAVSVGGRTKTIEQRQAEYERARAEIFQDESPPPTSATAQQSAAAASRSSSPPATPAQPQQ